MRPYRRIKPRRWRHEWTGECADRTAVGKTEGNGAFRFRTIVPAFYSGRTRHYHVKVQAPGSRLLTTQLYFPNEPANLRDVLFQSELLMLVADDSDGLDGRFDFVLNVR